MTTLETARLTIRNFNTNDWEALHEMRNQYEASELAVYDHQWPTSQEDIMSSISITTAAATPQRPARAAIGHAFEDLQADRVIAGTAAANRASCRLLERLGFTKTSEIIASFRNAPDGTPIQFTGYVFELNRGAPVSTEPAG